MFGIDAALSPIYVEQPHYIGSALPKYQTHYCKINHKRSIRPNHLYQYRRISSRGAYFWLLRKPRLVKIKNHRSTGP
ncbi:hypothetical protein CWC25_11815 [Pseudoalteromonas sp. S4389]|nr:hypothetical protein CWC25_11815 [Pseudoalteromonas sp. S4389]